MPVAPPPPPPPPPRAPHVVVVGGGITGLVAAHAVRRHLPASRVTLVEAASRLGGKLRTAEVAGLAVDEGADAFLAQVPEAVDLARAVGLGDELVAPATSYASLWIRGRLRPLPTGTVLGIPADLAALARARVLSPGGLARVPLDLVLPGRPVRTDVAIGTYVSKRLGREVVDRLVDPLLGGVYAGRADELSLDAALPQLAPAVHCSRSLLRAARAARPGTRRRRVGQRARGAGPGARGVGAGAQGAVPTPVFASLPGGLDRLAAAVAAAVRTGGAQIVCGQPVRAIERTPGGWRVVVGDTRSPRLLDADAVVLALPAAPAARLLAAAVPAAAVELAGIDYASVAIVTLAWARSALPQLPPGSGFLVPPAEGRVVKAVTFSSNKWAHLAAADRDLFAVRCSVGRYGEERDLQRDDVELAAVTAAEVAAVIGSRGPPVAHRVTRWGGALPQYAVGHLDRVARIRAAVAAQPLLAVCGAAYDGVGIPACIRSAETAAALIVGQLGQWADG